MFGRAVDEAMLPTYRRIDAMHRAGTSINGIAKLLTAEHVPTARGGARWYPSTIAAVLGSETLARLTA